jgi:N-acetylmuramic acid 6-phosphate (MurNAc-6-P) etherase
MDPRSACLPRPTEVNETTDSLGRSVRVNAAKVPYPGKLIGVGDGAPGPVPVLDGVEVALVADAP